MKKYRLEIFLIRHGATAANLAHCYQGPGDDPLCPEGACALRRAEFAPRRVWVTPLCRTGQTAEILFPAAEQIAVPGLREMHFGIFEGRSAAEMVSDAEYRRWVDGGCLGRIPGGESMAEFSARCRAAFLPLVDEALAKREERLVIVAHGGTLMALMAAFARPEQDYFSWSRPNGCGWLCETDSERWAAGEMTLLTPLCFTREDGE